jgi:hypothetical protein
VVFSPSDFPITMLYAFRAYFMLIRVLQDSDNGARISHFESLTS